MKTYTPKTHSETLSELFPEADRSGEALVRFMRRLELKMNRLAVCYCNGYTRERTTTGHTLNWDFSSLATNFGCLKRESYDQWRENCRYDHTQWEVDCDKALKLLSRVTGACGAVLDNIVFSGDARGYTLKLCGEFVKEEGIRIYTDLGGDGILAPEEWIRRYKR